MNKIQLEILGLSASPASNGAYALFLKETGGTRRMPIVIGATEAQAIAVELEGVKPPRPMTHDLIKNIIEHFNATVSEINIIELRDSTFYATISFDGSGIEIDARPSDAIALAVRFNAPIFVSEDIMNEVAFLPESSETEGEEEEEEDNLIDLLRQSSEDADKKQSTTAESEADNESILSYAEQLKRKLAAAISQENYELAAKIRDEMQKNQ